MSGTTAISPPRLIAGARCGGAYPAQPWPWWRGHNSNAAGQSVPRATAWRVFIQPLGHQREGGREGGQEGGMEGGREGGREVEVEVEMT